MSAAELPNSTINPKHIAIIMDGNGRWAKSKGLPRTAGHKQGAETTRKIITEAAKLGIKYLTIYAFSHENWNRPAKEVSFLMDLLLYQLRNEVKELHKAGVRLQVIGDREKLNSEVREAIKNAEELTAKNEKLNLIVALSYGSRQEMLKAVELSKGSPTEFEKNLYTTNIPDPDLLIRTGGEKRISNFLLWQIAYTELYFSDKLWPEFDETDLQSAIEDYSKRERRYGNTSEV